MPLVVLVIIGVIFDSVDRSFGAICTIAICAGGLMGIPLVISDYREKRILKRYRVTPVRSSVVLLAEVSMYVVYSLVSLISLFVVAAIFFDFRMRGSITYSAWE